MLQFFYRAWADSQPAAHADRPHDDRFAGYLASLAGVRAQERSGAFPWRARIHYLGAFATRRNPAVLQDSLSHLLRAPVRVREFVPISRRIVAEDRTRIGATGDFHSLGRDAVLGDRIRVIDDTVRVTVRVPDMGDYRRFLPNGGKFEIAREALDALLPSHIEWQLELEIAENQVEGARLSGNIQLGGQPG